MITGVWGKKIGMTQVFVNDVVHPVTAIDIGNWVITNIRKQDIDGYNAIQVGHVKKRYQTVQFSSDWLKNLKQYFEFVREIKVDSLEQFEIGKPITFDSFITQGDKIDAFGITKGCGFAGVVKRHDFTGARASHGSTMGKHPGSLGGARKQGKIFKGKPMAGHMGLDKRVMKNLPIVQVYKDAQVVLVHGSMPGKAGSLVYLRKI